MLALESKQKKKLRASGPKVKTGCITCRIRRVKCDEMKPDCRRCTSTGRKCDGYRNLPGIDLVGFVSQPPNRCSLTSVGLLSDVNGTKEDLRSFDFFRSRTAVTLSGYFDRDFWAGLLLQACHSDLTIRHAMMAVSSIHEQYESRRTQATRSHPNEADSIVNHFALRHYNLAIRSLINRVSHRDLPLDTMLLTCVLFTCTEFLRGDRNTSIVHVLSGARLLRTYREESRAPSRERLSLGPSNLHLIEEVLVPLFARLKILTTLFEGLPSGLYSSRESNISDSSICPPRFSNIAQARTSLVYIGDAVVRFDKSARSCMIGLEDDIKHREIQHEIKVQAEQWSAAFREFLNSSLAHMSSSDLSGATLLLIQHKAFSLLLVSSLVKEQTISEVYNPDFDAIVTLSHFMSNSTASWKSSSSISPEFSFEMGIIPPLYLSATKCKSPTIRRRAVNLLASSPRQEALWNSSEAVRMAESIMHLEEDTEVFEDYTEFVRKCENINEGQELCFSRKYPFYGPYRPRALWLRK